MVWIVHFFIPFSLFQFLYLLIKFKLIYWFFFWSNLSNAKSFIHWSQLGIWSFWMRMEIVYFQSTSMTQFHHFNIRKLLKKNYGRKRNRETLVTNLPSFLLFPTTTNSVSWFPFSSLETDVLVLEDSIVVYKRIADVLFYISGSFLDLQQLHLFTFDIIRLLIW